MANLNLLGIFEDVAQRDFHLGLLQSYGRMHGHQLRVTPRLTSGCRFDFLAEHLSYAAEFDGVVVAVDGKKMTVQQKTEALLTGLDRRGGVIPECPVLWSVALPCVEEWMMADQIALPQALQEELRLQARPHAPRPGRAGAELTAKARLREWSAELVGRPLLRSGLEYAEIVASLVSVDSVGRGRNPDLYDLLDQRLPNFIRECSR